ncbi:MAG: hypothetical protein AAGJ10_04340 [Bacteroidota bacterium]
MSDPDAAVPAVWWGDFHVAEGEVACWHIGPLHVWLERRPNEWRLVQQAQADPMEVRTRVMVPLDAEQVGAFRHATESAVPLRFTRATEDAPIRVMPALADRPVVVRPEAPLWILPGQAATLYVSTPLWVSFSEGNHAMTELPSLRPPDTWFGPSTQEGELCYASRTDARLVLDDLPKRMNRAVTPVNVLNKGSDPLHLTRIKLPTEHLTLYRSIHDFLWTQAVDVEREADQDNVTITMHTRPPEDAAQPQVLVPPRRKSRLTIINRISGWFSL